MRSNLTSVALCLVSLMLCIASPSYANKNVDDAKKDISGIQKQISNIKKKLSKSKAAKNDATDALKASETAISQASKALFNINQQQKEYTQKLNELNRKSLTINKQMASQQKELSGILYQQYAQGSDSYAKLILQSKQPSEVSRNLKYQTYIAKAHRKLIQKMQVNLNEIQQLNQQTTLTLEKVAALKVQQETEHAKLKLQKREKALVLKKLSTEIATQRGKLKKLQRDEKRLSDLVKKLNEVANKKKRKKPSSKVIAKNNQTPDNRYAGKKFASLKGKLKLPVRGEVLNRFGNKRKDSSVTWKGLFIRAKEGAKVKSVAGGRIVFAEWMRGFGNLIIIDHGSGFMSLYGNNQSILRNVGEMVKGGDVIAAVGNTGGNKTNGLYYELRKKSIPFDPMKWSAVK